MCYVFRSFTVFLYANVWRTNDFSIEIGQWFIREDDEVNEDDESCVVMVERMILQAFERYSTVSC